MLALYSLSIFLGAALVFLIQPMLARMVLPYYGGSPAVWNTCLVFFQAGLLAGYAYAHYGNRRLGFRTHAALHLALLALPLALLLIRPGLWLPFSVDASWAPSADASVALHLLMLLAITAGVPFVLVSATAPLLQQWFSLTGHHTARDPYYLYAASNLGSIVALLAYPFVVNRLLGLEQQAWLWTAGYGLLAVLVLACGFVVLTRNRHSGDRPGDELDAHDSTAAAGNVHDRSSSNTRPWLWMALAFVPSSLLLSVSTYLTTDLAPDPLLWVIPLSLYLLTFILAFQDRFRWLFGVAQRAFPLVIVLVTIVLLSEATDPVLLLISLHLLGLFTVGLVCHGRLYQSRPVAEHLTEFYLWLAIGGVLGGVFNALIAPVVFRHVGLAEYPLMLAIACLLYRPFEIRLRNSESRKELVLKDVLPAAAIGLTAWIMVHAADWLTLPEGPLRIGVVFGVPAVLCYTLMDRPIRFGLGIAGIFLAGTFFVGVHGRAEHVVRSFFGVHRITRVTIEKGGVRRVFRQLVHGTTTHGQQSLDLLRGDYPLTYYHVDSPIGHVFHAWEDMRLKPANCAATVAKASVQMGLFSTLEDISARRYGHLRPLRNVGVIGLGAGSLAYYARPGQSWTFFEIDPAVVDIARTYFTFLPQAEKRLARNGRLNVVIGDGRLQLERWDGPPFDLLVIDAFSSDSVPLHLLTLEAMEIYRLRLKQDGVVAFHISNRYLDFEPVLARLAEESGWVAYGWHSSLGVSPEGEDGKSSSHWVLMGGPDSALQWLRLIGGWRRLTEPGPLWTDDFADILSIYGR